jgi:endonuclease/exonuclease/phosphatase family metal-dependent hydrolase
MFRLITANIEGDRHLEKLVPFFASQSFDIVCLQEVFQSDVMQLVGPDFQVEFLPMCLKANKAGDLFPWGAAIASRLPVKKVISRYYYKPNPELAPYDEKKKRQTIAQGLVGLQLVAGDRSLNVITTHFTWTPDGAPDANQDKDIVTLLDMLALEPPHILCGDFNIPRRQNHHYPTLAHHYTDHIPQDIESSVYVPLHYAREKPGVAQKLSGLMVDYIFSTPNAYRVENVERHGALSDHWLFTADITAV